MQCIVPQNLTRNQRKKLNRRLRNQSSTTSVAQPQLSIVPFTAQVSQPGAQGSRKKKRRNRKRNARGGRGQSNVRNYYLASLIDPENYPGAKVPDLVTFPSSTFQLTYDGVISPGSAGTAPTTYGDGILCWFTPVIGNNSTVFPISIGNNTTPGGNFTDTSTNWPARANVPNLYDVYRPVSAALYAEFVGNSAYDSGQICMGLIPRTAAGPGSTVANFNAAISQSFTKTVPLRNGAVLTWKPQDNLDLEYNPLPDAAGRVYPPQIFVACAGMNNSSTTGAASIRIRCIANFEAIPTTDTFNLVDTSPSQSDAKALEEAFNWGSQVLNNMNAFVTNISPYVQPALNQATRYGATYLSNRLASEMGNSLRRRIM